MFLLHLHFLQPISDRISFFLSGRTHYSAHFSLGPRATTALPRLTAQCDRVSLHSNISQPWIPFIYF